MDFQDLDINLNGRQKKPLHFGEPEPLALIDLQTLGTECATKAPDIKKLRSGHHALARALASGMKPGEAGLLTGYSPSRVSILQADPSFKELLVLYRSNTQERYYEMHDRLAQLGKDSADEIIQRLEDTPEDFSITQLTDIMTKTADRSGNGPTSTTVDVRIGLADKLNAAQARLDKYRTIDATDATLIEEV